MGDYFNLEVFVHALEMADPAFVEATLGFPDAHSFPRIPYALAFQFLDYPLLLVYAKEPALQASALSQQDQPYPFDYVTFDSGKSCVLQSDPQEMQFLLEQVSRTRAGGAARFIGALGSAGLPTHSMHVLA